MIPYQYSETVAVAEIPAHQEAACVTYCDVQAQKRCRTGVTLAPGLCPTSFRDSVIVYGDSTRRRYVSRVDYSTRLKPLVYSDTSVSRPRLPPRRSFAACVDHRADTHRKWYKSSVQLAPRKYTSSTDVIAITTTPEVTERKSDYNRMSSSMTASADASMESLDYLSSDCNGTMGGGSSSSPDVLSPLRLNGLTSPTATQHSMSLLDNSQPEVATTTTIITYSSFRRELNGNVDRDDNANYSEDPSISPAMIHRSGPFVYNTTRRPGASSSFDGDDDNDDDNFISARNSTYNSPITSSSRSSRDVLNGEIHMTNGYHSHSYEDDMMFNNYQHHQQQPQLNNRINGFHLPEDPEEDLIMDL